MKLFDCAIYDALPRKLLSTRQRFIAHEAVPINLRERVDGGISSRTGTLLESWRQKIILLAKSRGYIEFFCQK